VILLLAPNRTRRLTAHFRRRFWLQTHVSVETRAEPRHLRVRLSVKSTDRNSRVRVRQCMTSNRVREAVNSHARPAGAK
jgi:hypothetical protein